MKRSLLVAALSTLAAGSALAQSSVTVYGRLNTTIENQDDGSNDKWLMNNNASRLGFRGTEDLGGGLKANFTLEHRFNSDTGRATNPAFWGGAGETSVSLVSKAGMVKAGHYTSEAYYATADVAGLLNHDTGTSSDFLYKYLNNDDNKASYRTPEFAGVWAELAVLLGEGVQPNRAYDFAANWASGPFGVGFGYEKSPTLDYQYGIRGSYSASPFTIAGYFQRFSSEGADKAKNIYRLSGQYDIGALELHLSGGMADELDGTGIAFDEGKARQITTGLNYNLSKRTKLYGYYSRVDIDGINGGADQEQTNIAVGVRHNF